MSVSARGAYIVLTRVGAPGQEREREELGVWRIEWEEEMQSGAASSGR